MGLVDKARALGNQTENDLSNLQNKISPYEHRYNVESTLVQYVNDDVEELSETHSAFQDRTRDLTFAINVTLRNRVIQVNTTLYMLKTITTPVFVLALSAEELMNRTIDGLRDAQNTISLLANISMNISHSASAANNSHSRSGEAIQALTLQSQQLSVQANTLSELVTELKNLTTTALSSTNEISIQISIAEVLAEYLQQNFSSLEQSIASLDLQLQTEIDMMNVSLRLLKDNIPGDVTSETYIKILNENFSSLQDNISLFQSEILYKQSQVANFKQNVYEIMQKINSLTQNLTNLRSIILQLNNHSQVLYSRAETAVQNVLREIHDAEQVSMVLQNYSENLHEVARAAEEALESLQDIFDIARHAIVTTTVINNNVLYIADTVDQAMGQVNEAKNITQQAMTVRP